MYHISISNEISNFCQCTQLSFCKRVIQKVIIYKTKNIILNRLMFAETTYTTHTW